MAAPARAAAASSSACATASRGTTITTQSGGAGNAASEEWQRRSPIRSYAANVFFPARKLGCSHALDSVASGSARHRLRSEMNVSPALTIEAVCYSSDDSVIKLLETEGRHIKTLAKVSGLKISAPAGRPENCATAVAGNIEIFVPLKGLINFEEEEKRLKKDIEKIERELLAVERKMSNKEFLEKAPKEVVEKDKARLEELLQKKMKLEQGVERVK